jgi:hypothetical protein
MNPNELIKAIKLLRPTAEFSFTENDYSTIKWDVLEGDAPTLAELKDAVKQIKLQEASEEKAKAEAKGALLERLGITADEAALLLG